MSNQIEQIRAEIGRRNLANYCGTAEQYEEELFAILDTIEAEEKAHPVPSDVQEAAEKAALHYDMGTDGVAYQDGYKDGMLAERERLMKNAPVADVIEMRGSTETEYPVVLKLGFPRIPNIEYHGGKVRVIIEEINQTTLK